MVSRDETRVIVVCPTGRDSVLIERLLTSAGIRSVACSTIAAALAEAKHGVGGFLIADEAVDAGSDAKVNRFRDAQPAWSDVPIILLTRKPRGDTQAPGERLGRVSVIERPVGKRPLLTAVESALRARGRQYEARTQLAELRRIGDELRAANSMKDELLALVSHELRTPLTGILGCANILERRYDELDATDRQTLLRDIGDHASRLQRIIENMLTLSRADTAEDTALEPVLVQRTLPALLLRMNPLRGGRSIRVTVEREPPPVAANPVFLEQVVTNLVRNSEKYAAPGSVVDVHIFSKGDRVIISVADRGAQIGQEQVNRMFETFYRDPGHELKISGLGLGLPVCKRLTEAQGGTIHATPREGGGLVVTVAMRMATE